VNKRCLDFVYHYTIIVGTDIIDVEEYFCPTLLMFLKKLFNGFYFLTVLFSSWTNCLISHRYSEAKIKWGSSITEHKDDTEPDLFIIKEANLK